MSDPMGSPPAIEDQARLLEDALVLVRQQAHLMRKCLETPGKLMDALKCRYEARTLTAVPDAMKTTLLILISLRKAPLLCQSSGQAV